MSGRTHRRIAATRRDIGSYPHIARSNAHRCSRRRQRGLRRERRLRSSCARRRAKHQPRRWTRFLRRSMRTHPPMAGYRPLVYRRFAPERRRSPPPRRSSYRRRRRCHPRRSTHRESRSLRSRAHRSPAQASQSRRPIQHETDMTTSVDVPRCAGASRTFQPIAEQVMRAELRPPSRQCRRLWRVLPAPARRCRRLCADRR